MKKGTFTTKDGAQLAYRVHGDDTSRPPFVMFNGMSAVMEDWSPLVEELARSRKGEKEVMGALQFKAACL